MSFKNIAGDSKSIIGEMTTSWNETTLPIILSRYLGIWVVLPMFTKQDLPFKGRKMVIWKGYWMGMLNMRGKSKNRRCFKGIKSLSC